jgi:uncharacterized integral membrane protein
MVWRFILTLVFAIIIALFAIQNSGEVDINFLYGNFTVSQVLVILFSVALGAIVVLLLGIIKQMKLKKNIKNASKKLEDLEKENNSLNKKIVILDNKLQSTLIELEKFKENTTLKQEDDKKSESE